VAKCPCPQLQEMNARLTDARLQLEDLKATADRLERELKAREDQLRGVLRLVKETP